MDKIKCYFGLDDVSKVEDCDFRDKLTKILIALRDEDICVMEEIFPEIFSFLTSKTEDRYLYQLLLKGNRKQLNRNVLITMLHNADYHNPLCACGDMQNVQREVPHLYIESIEKLHKVKVNFLTMKGNFYNIDDDFKRCFSNIFFYGKSNMSVFQLADLPEIIKALDALDQSGMEIYNECNRNGGQALKKLNTIVSCSGENNASKCVVEVLINDARYTINVSPHFKIGRRDSNKRIYFAWGNIDALKNRIIVYSIGKHLLFKK